MVNKKDSLAREIKIARAVKGYTQGDLATAINTITTKAIGDTITWTGTTTANDLGCLTVAKLD